MRKSIFAAIAAATFTVSAAEKPQPPAANSNVPVSEMKLPDLFMQASALRCTGLARFTPKRGEDRAVFNRNLMIIQRAEAVEQDIVKSTFKKYAAIAQDPSLQRNVHVDVRMLAVVAAITELELKFSKRSCDPENHFGERSPLAANVSPAAIDQVLRELKADPNSPPALIKLVEGLKKMDPAKFEKFRELLRQTHADGVTTPAEVVQLIAAQNNMRGPVLYHNSVARLAKNILENSGLVADQASTDAIAKDLMHRAAGLEIATDMVDQLENSQAPRPRM